jgi:membrane-bound lytic murein transglycosylase D
VEELAEANQLRSSDNLQGVEGLAVPQAPAAAIPAHVALYTVHRGETLVTVADRFGVSLSDLRRWNGITGYKVEPGRRLHVAEPVGVSHASRSRRRAASTGVAAREHASAPAKAATQAAAPHGARTASGASRARQAPAHKPSTKRKTATRK